MERPVRLGARVALAVLAILLTGKAQVIEFESGGLLYQTQTKRGVTVMFAQLPATVREYSIVQIAVANGSRSSCMVRPEDVIFHRTDGATIIAAPARKVVGELIDKGGRGDVIRLVSTYELGLYGMTRMKSTNGYEQRRQAAFAEVESTRIKAAAAASAIVLVQTVLTPGQSTDGAVFFPTAGKPLGTGKLAIRSTGEVFEFDLKDRMTE